MTHAHDEATRRQVAMFRRMTAALERHRYERELHGPVVYHGSGQGNMRGAEEAQAAIYRLALDSLYQSMQPDPLDLDLAAMTWEWPRTPRPFDWERDCPPTNLRELIARSNYLPTGGDS